MAVPKSYNEAEEKTLEIWDAPSCKVMVNDPM